jgi:hypothetical protein
MTTSTAGARSISGRVGLVAGLVALALLLAPGARPGGNSITACDGVTTACDVGTVPAANGVYFTVSTGGGNRDFASVAVSCDNGYATVLTVEVPAKGTGTSQIIYPPAGACTATLEKLMQIGKAHDLGSVSFTVA